MTQAAFGPTPSLEYASSSNEWNQFYEDLVNKETKAFDKIIGVIDDCIRQERGEKVLTNFDDEPYKTQHPGIFEGDIKNIGIFNHFYRFIRQRSYERDLDRTTEEGKRHEWNLANNLLRSLRMARDNHAFQLPETDKRGLLTFIETLKQPPIDPFSN